MSADLPTPGAWTVFPDWSPDLLKARVYNQILLDIVLGELAPGSRLDETVLTQRYDAGLAGVRDALGRLALEGLVVRRPRAGTTVSVLDLVEVSQAFEARRLIEPHCAALAATHATAEDIAILRSTFDGAEAAVRDKDARILVDMDQRFHEGVARASRNLTLARILIPLQHKAARFWVYSMGRDTDDDQLREIERHKSVIDCIARHDVERARTGMLRILGDFSDEMRRATSA